jgi:hypothetical protein
MALVYVITIESPEDEVEQVDDLAVESLRDTWAKTFQRSLDIEGFHARVTFFAGDES